MVRHSFEIDWCVPPVYLSLDGLVIHWSRVHKVGRVGSLVYAPSSLVKSSSKRSRSVESFAVHLNSV